MGINIQTLKLLLEENRYKPIYGNVLLIGRSTVTISDERVKKLFKDYGKDPSSLIFEQNFNKTRHANNDYYIDDVLLFKSLSNQIESVSVLDVSNYEGASITADLNFPIPKEHLNKFDFIYDSSVLDNIFNPAQGIVNIAKMLKNRGRVLHLHHSSFFPGSMVACHPEWFYGFYACNRFLDVKVYLAEQVSPGWNRFEFETNLFKYKPSFTSSIDYDRFLGATNKSAVYYCLSIAEADDLWEKRKHVFPSNLQYISSSKEFQWPSLESIFSKNDRPIVGATEKKVQDVNMNDLPLGSDHFEYLATKF